MLKIRFFLYLSLLLFTLSGANSLAQDSITNIGKFNKLVKHFEKDFASKNQKTVAIASWNIEHLGRTKTSSEIDSIVKIIKSFDLVAIQEVVAKDPAGAQKVAQIANRLNQTGSKWDYQISDPTKSTSPYVRERYAILWKTSVLKMIRRGVLDQKLADKVDREPFIASFRRKGVLQTFYIATIHTRPQDSLLQKEIAHLIDYPKRFNTDHLIILGDFNTGDDNAVWDAFYQTGFNAALTNSQTTLKRRCRRHNYLSKMDDNLFYTSGIKILQSGRVDFVRTCHNLKKAREISDHLPVFMEFEIQIDPQ